MSIGIANTALRICSSVGNRFSAGCLAALTSLSERLRYSMSVMLTRDL